MASKETGPDHPARRVCGPLDPWDDGMRIHFADRWAIDQEMSFLGFLQGMTSDMRDVGGAE